MTKAAQSNGVPLLQVQVASEAPLPSTLHWEGADGICSAPLNLAQRRFVGDLSMPVPAYSIYRILYIPTGSEVVPE